MAMTNSIANEHISKMAPYAVANLSTAGGLPLLSMAQNESIRPPSPNAIEAGRAVMKLGAEYPDPDYPNLRDTIAEFYRIDADRILCAAGSMELINCITQAFAGPGRRVLSSEYGYALFRNSAEKVMAPFDTAKEINYTVSVDNLIESVRPDTALVYVANPGNPTGTKLPLSEMVRLREGLPDQTVLVIDEAYGEFTDEEDLLSSSLLDASNLIILRTLSKAYGLASARVGWGVFPSNLGSEVRKLIIPSSVSSVSAAMASAAIADQAYMRETCDLTNKLREDFHRQVTEIGLHCINSHTNFVLIEFPSVDLAVSADKALRDVGVIMRGMGGYNLPQCLRATVANSNVMKVATERLVTWARENLR